jgi:hypothetical protein
MQVPMMAEQVHPTRLDPLGVTRSEVETVDVIRRRRVRIPSWLEADPPLHREAVYIEADRFFHQEILLAIGRRTIHRVLSFVVTNEENPSCRYW